MGEGNDFTGVCHSVPRGRGCDIEEVSAQGVKTDPSPPHEMASAAVGTHPTGMHSCDLKSHDKIGGTLIFSNDSTHVHLRTKMNSGNTVVPA